MGLALVVGPAHAGKVALLLERYLDVLDRDPWLVVPNRFDIERVEHDLIRRRPALLAGRIGTFDDLFEAIAGEAGRSGIASASSARSRCGARSPGVSPGASARPRPHAASPRPCSRRSARSTRLSSIRIV